MKRSNLLVSLAWVSVLLASGRAQEPVRRFQSNGHPIVSQLRSTDRHVEMDINDFPPMMVRASTSRTPIELFVDTCDVIVTGQAEEARPRLVTRHFLETTTATEATATWITSTVRLRIPVS
jgi:hypothetical protein